MRIQKVKYHYQGGENEVIVKLPLLVGKKRAGNQEDLSEKRKCQNL